MNSDDPYLNCAERIDLELNILVWEGIKNIENPFLQRAAAVTAAIGTFFEELIYNPVCFVAESILMLSGKGRIEIFVFRAVNTILTPLFAPIYAIIILANALFKPQHVVTFIKNFHLEVIKFGWSCLCTAISEKKS